jgi:hypothetical protein
MRMPGSVKEDPMARPLNLEQLRKRSRELLRAVTAGDSKALGRVTAVLPHVAQKSFRLAHAQTVIARECRFPSWPKLKAAIENEEARRKRRIARQNLVAHVTGEILVHARANDALALTQVQPVGKDAGSEIVAAISADPANLEMVVDAYIAGLVHPNPKVRYECAHALDRYGHPRAVEPLIALSHDPVPRVRWMALHALSCDACKVQRPVAAVAFERACAMAVDDTSVQVRRHATIAVGQLGGAEAAAVLARIAREDSDEVVRRNARGMLRQLAR